MESDKIWFEDKNKTQKFCRDYEKLLEYKKSFEHKKTVLMEMESNNTSNKEGDGSIKKLIQDIDTIMVGIEKTQEDYKNKYNAICKKIR